MMQYNKPYSFEKTDVRGLFYFNFFKRNVETKNVCPIAYNVWCFAKAGLRRTNVELTTKDN